MSKLNIACLLSPMVDTEGPMEIVDGKVLAGPKKIMGKYGEIGLEATITFGEEHPDSIHTDILSVGNEKEVGSIQQSAIAMFQPAKHPGSLAVHALGLDQIDQKDAFEVADILVAMLNNLPNKPDLIFAGRESWDYSHGIVGPAVARALGMPYFSGVNEIKLNDDHASVTATVIEGNDKVTYQIALPAVFGTTDWLNGKDSARFTSLKGVMMAKKFKRTPVDAGSLDLSGAQARTDIRSIEPVVSERKNRKLEGDDYAALAKEAVEILINQDKALVAGAANIGDSGGGGVAIQWSEVDAVDFSGDVVLVADHDGKTIRKSTHQALSQARKIAGQEGKRVSLLVLAQDPSLLGSSATGFGADRVVGVGHDALAHPTVEAMAKSLDQLFNTTPAYFMTVANDLGRDLAAYMAAKFGGGLLQDIVSLDLADGELTGDRIVSNARFRTREGITQKGSCQSISIRATAFDPVPQDIDTGFLLLKPDNLELQAEVKTVEAGEETKGIPLNEAKIIVSGGRGMKAADNFSHLHTLSDVLGGTVGASRAVTDLEWVPHNLQIGQTGTTVAPDVYFAIGISGAIQHLTGMLGSKYIIAVNPDADAPIHKHADLTIIGKWENVLPPLTDALRAAFGK